MANQISGRRVEEAQRLANGRGEPHAIIRYRASSDLEILPLKFFIPIANQQLLVYVTWPAGWRYRGPQVAK